MAPLMRILHVTREVAGDRRFGIGRSLDPVIHALQQAGHQVRYLTQLDQSPRAMQAQHRWTERLLPRMRKTWGDAGDLFLRVWIERLNMGRLAAKVAASWPADVVHLHDPWMAWGFRVGRWLNGPRARACRWGFTEHGFGSYTQAIGEEGVPYTPFLRRVNLWLERSVARAADWVVCPTALGRRRLAVDLGLHRAAAHWVTIPHSRPTLVPMPRAEARRQLGWADGRINILAVGRLNPVKRFDTLVKACLATGREMRLTLLGEGDPAPLHALVEAAQAGSRLCLEVRLVEDVSPWLGAADVYVSSTRNESFGIANLEALAAGLPALCTAAGGVPEVVGPGARLVPAQDERLVEALSTALIDLIDNPQERERLGAAGAAHAAQWPDAAAVGRLHEALYRGLAPGPRP